ncbi:MAG: DUF5606 domain-containing protein [Flavobacteriaceae bacterium]|nr:DUF5606 domain-containing protein [Flavobacteriaceae bacterium]
MTIEKIVAISGKPGLFEILSHSKGGLIVRSLIDNKRFPVNAMQNVSVLSDIAIYTYEEEVPLRTIFMNIAEKENGKETISHKESNDTLLSFMSEVLPNYDDERVYASNVKKIVQWYNILVNAKFDFSTLEEKEETTEE